MDFEPEAIIEKLKKNKLALPAIAIGAGIGIFLLVRNGGSDQSLQVLSGEGIPATTDTGSVSGSTGGSSDGGISDLQNQIAQVASSQEALGTSFQDALNQLSDSLFGALNQQSQSVNDALANQATGQASYPDLAGELQSLGQAYFGQFDHLNSIIPSPVTNDYSLSPSVPQLTGVNTAQLAAQIAQKQALGLQKLQAKVPPVQTIVKASPTPIFQSLGQASYNIGAALGNVFKTPPPTPNVPSYPTVGHASVFNPVNYADIGNLSGYGKYASTAPKISPFQIAINKITKSGSGKVQPTQY